MCIQGVWDDQYKGVCSRDSVDEYKWRMYEQSLYVNRERCTSSAQEIYLRRSLEQA